MDFSLSSSSDSDSDSDDDEIFFSIFLQTVATVFDQEVERSDVNRKSECHPDNAPHLCEQFVPNSPQYSSEDASSSDNNRIQKKQFKFSYGKV